ncbi:MAG TPA: flagellar biosynthetic protein FliO [Clostridiales bacterium]|nr:flagellar biosynthetic protein FliO [Clostridiales bacterium]
MIAINDIFPLIISIIGIILVLFLTYYCTKWLSTKTSMVLKSKYMSIADKMMLGQNKFLAIAEINNKYYLLGITENSINILKELDGFHPLPQEKPENNIEFSKILNKLLKKPK